MPNRKLEITNVAGPELGAGEKGRDSELGLCLAWV
jgi:hypothetical protein